MTHEQKPESAEFRTREAQHSQLGEALSDEVSGEEKAVERWYAYALKHILEAEARGAAGRDTYQSRVADWMAACFGPEISADRMERNHRFLEEAIELVQATGCTRSEAHQLVDYVYGRPVGDPVQEVGGVMVTLAALCSAHAIKLKYAAEAELARVWTKVEKIRAKQAAKPKHSPLPEHVAEQRRKDAEGAEPVAWLISDRLKGKPGCAHIVDRTSTNRAYAEYQATLGFDVTPLCSKGSNVAALEARVKELEGELGALLDWADGQWCPHDNTHRGGSIWTICNDCGRKWADDVKPFDPDEDFEPSAIKQARAAIREGGEHG